MHPLAESLDLAPHPEGGWFRQTWASPEPVAIPAGIWQRTVPSDADALVSCLVSPGFDVDDFELA